MCKCHCQKAGTVQSAACFPLRRCASPETLSSLQKDEVHMFSINEMTMFLVFFLSRVNLLRNNKSFDLNVRHRCKTIQYPFPGGH